MTKFTENNCGNLETGKLVTNFNVWKLFYQSENLPEYFMSQTKKKATIPVFWFLVTESNLKAQIFTL